MKVKLTRASQRDEHTLAGAYAMDAISAADRVPAGPVSHSS